MNLMKMSAFVSLLRCCASCGGLIIAAAAHAGTYYLVGNPDTSLLGGTHTSTNSPGTGSSCSWSAAGDTLTLHGNATAQCSFGHNNESASTSLMGPVVWRVRWIPSYSGEPVPTSRSVQVTALSVSGSGNAISLLAYAQSYGSGSSGVSLARYNSDDVFCSATEVQASGSYGQGAVLQPGGSMGGSVAWYTDDFIETTPGVYESKITYDVNTTGSVSAQMLGNLAGTASGTVGWAIKYTIVSIDNQSVSLVSQ